MQTLGCGHAVYSQCNCDSHSDASIFKGWDQDDR